MPALFPRMRKKVPRHVIVTVYAIILLITALSLHKSRFKVAAWLDRYYAPGPKFKATYKRAKTTFKHTLQHHRSLIKS